MIRPLSFAVLMCAASIVLAQPLYKWVEPDGSITFSVKPPPAGIDYETVDAARSDKTAKQAAASAMQSQMPPGVSAPQSQTSPPAQPSQRVAPQLGAQISEQNGIQRAPTPLLNDGRATSNRNPAADNGQRVAALATKTRKQRQCEDLKKRVVSLERRLRNRLTPEDMDNTVVHMARYQRSYDQHCVQ